MTRSALNRPSATRAVVREPKSDLNVLMSETLPGQAGSVIGQLPNLQMLNDPADK